MPAISAGKGSESPQNPVFSAPRRRIIAARLAPAPPAVPDLMNRMRFFFYGTLMDPDVLRLVLGRDLGADALQPAVLTGFWRGFVRGASYPTLVPRAHARVDGLLAQNLNEDDALRLTWYEHDLYDIRLCRPRLAAGTRLAAWTYLPKPGAMPAGEAWSLSQWQRQHKAAFLARISHLAGADGPPPRKLARARRAWRRRRP